MPAIGISGSYGGLNMGDEAILASILGGLRRNFPDAELVVFSRDAEHTRAEHDAERVVPARGVSREEILPEIERLDLFILGGGGILYDGEARIYLRDVRLAQKHDIPAAAISIGAGPLEDPEDRQVVQEVVSRMEHVTVRDHGSKRTLEDAGVERTIQVAADPAVLLDANPYTTEMLRNEGIRGDRVVGMSVREPGRAAPHLDVEGYHALMAHLADFIVHRFGAEIVFVPMERDDIRHSHAVIARMIAADRGHVLKGHYGPREILGLMEHLSFVVAMRLHLLIFAARAGVPFLALPYASKVSEFVASVGLQAPGDVTRESAGALLASVDRLWDSPEHHLKIVSERFPELRQRARESCASLADLIRMSTP